MGTKYLYGASVQGIQSFIFQTNALQEIAGASELVEQICTTLFADAIGSSIDNLEQDPNAILTAAGNIKYLFDDPVICRALVLNFSKTVMEYAPGITLSQAVVQVSDRQLVQADFDELETKLKAQRNKPFNPIGWGLMAINRSRRTGLPTVEIVNSKKGKLFLDEGLKSKRQNNINRISKAFFTRHFTEQKLPFELKDITKSKGENYSWLAVIHADGNNMGALIHRMASEIDSKGEANFIEKFRSFSLTIDKSTKEAASEAYAVISSNCKLENHKYPFRPVVIGGDDLTVICRADLALEFTKLFLEKFEEKTRTSLSSLNLTSLNHGLTACAGIAYVKESYPFHYGYQLAEELCTHAKSEARKLNSLNNGLTPSCLMFHKVLDSFIENYHEIISRELSADEVSFDFGPYFINNEPGVSKLIKQVEVLEDEKGNAIKSSLRQWLTDLYKNRELADQKMDRLLSIGDSDKLKQLDLKNNKGIVNMKSPVFDWLSIASINQGGN